MKIMKREEFFIPSRDGEHKLHVTLWEPDTQVKAVVQISHGMTEMVERYEHFARFLNGHGYAVIGNDHLGHGLTAGDDGDLGYFCPENMSATVVADLHRVTLYAKKRYGEIPYFLFGHSMGSFMARRYLMTYGEGLSGAIICGTGRQNPIALAAGRLVAGCMRRTLGERYRSKLLNFSAFGSYQRRIKGPRTKKDWLTRDSKIVDSYLKNKYCGYLFTVNGYRTLFETLSFIQDRRNVKRIPQDMPLYFIAGGEDPVGNYGNGVMKVAAGCRKAGISDISLKIYPNDRHELLNELDREQVYADVLSWIESKIFYAHGREW